MLRVCWTFDDEPDDSRLEQWDTPEKYKDNEVVQDGRTVPFDEYIQYWGNPKRHVILLAVVEQLCDACGSWVPRASLGNVDFMDDDSFVVDEVIPEDKVRERLKGYQLEVSLELFGEARSGSASDIQR